MPPRVRLPHDLARAVALAFARRGRLIFPLHTIDPAGHCTCGRSDCPSPAKHPRVANGFLAATTSEPQLKDWWHRWPAANVGLATGVRSGLAVLDVDPDHGGGKSLAALEQAHDALPPTVTVLTGGGGFHFYFAHPGGYVPSSAGRLGPGLDLRGDGGYVVAPPSRHASGRRYRFAPGTADRSLAPVPGWLQDRIVARPRAGTSFTPPASGAPGWIATALAELNEGSRNTTLHRIAGWLRRYGATEADIFALLAPHADRVGLAAAELQALVRSAARYSVVVSIPPRNRPRTGGHPYRAPLMPSGVTMVEVGP